MFDGYLYLKKRFWHAISPDSSFNPLKNVCERGGGVIHLPKRFLQVAQIFTKQSKGN